MEQNNDTNSKHQLIQNLIDPSSPTKQLRIDAETIAKTKYVFSSHAEFMSGYLAACTSITLLFPLNKLIFRQILDGVNFKSAFKQLKDEGFQHAYRGLLPPLLQKSVSYSIMFGTQNEYSLWLKRLSERSKAPFIINMNPNIKSTGITAISGGLAGLTEAFLTPFERVQSVLQMQQFHNRYKHTWHVFNEISRDHGVKELYRGISAICVRNSLSNAVFFTSRAKLKTFFPKTKNKLKNTVFDFVNGSLLGALISTLFYPFNVLKSHMQARVGGKHLSMYGAFRMVYESRDRKILMLYKGVGSNFLRAIFAWGITNSAYEFSLNYFKKTN